MRHLLPDSNHWPLGPVDEFGEDEHKAESDEGSVVPGSFFASESNALEALELPDALLDAGASAVERFRKESAPVLGICLGGNDGADAAGSGGLAVGLAVVALVADCGARRDVIWFPGDHFGWVGFGHQWKLVP